MLRKGDGRRRGKELQSRMQTGRVRRMNDGRHLLEKVLVDYKFGAMIRRRGKRERAD